MPCSDGRDRQGWSSGYSEGAHAGRQEKEQEIKRVLETNKGLQQKLDLVSSYLCTVIRSQALINDCTPSALVEHLTNENPEQFKGFQIWWKQHNEQDIMRIQNALQGMDKFDKMLILDIVQEELSSDD